MVAGAAREGSLSAPTKPRLVADVAGSVGGWGEVSGNGEVHAETGNRSKGERGSKWSKRDNSHRGNRLVAFLVEWMGLEEMRSGAGVLDVAGGAGLVTFELVWRRGVSTTCVDPRPMKLSAKQRHKMLWRRERLMQMPDALAGRGCISPQQLLRDPRIAYCAPGPLGLGGG